MFWLISVLYFSVYIIKLIDILDVYTKQYWIPASIHNSHISASLLFTVGFTNGMATFLVLLEHAKLRTSYMGGTETKMDHCLMVYYFCTRMYFQAFSKALALALFIVLSIALPSSAEFIIRTHSRSSSG